MSYDLISFEEFGMFTTHLVRAGMNHLWIKRGGEESQGEGILRSAHWKKNIH